MIDFILTAKEQGDSVTYEDMVSLSVMLGEEADAEKSADRNICIA